MKDKKQILLLTKYSRMGASSRLRTLQYLPLLEQQGFEFTVHSLFCDDYLKALYSGSHRSFLIVIKSYLKRLSVLFTVLNYDLIWIEKEIFPYMPSFFERILVFIGVKYIVDYDDAIFHNYDLSKNKFIKLFLSNKINSVMKYSSCVITGNTYLSNYAQLAGAKNTQIIPTVVDHTRYQKSEQIVGSILTVGWIGSPSTQKYVVEILSALQAVHQQFPFRLLLIGANSDVSGQLPGLNVEVLNWTEETEAELISMMDIGIMPLHDGPWERGKCGYKLIQYMASGVSVVASPVGVNEEIVKKSNAGFIAKRQDEWECAILKLLVSATLREEKGKAGRDVVEKKYSLKSQAANIACILNYSSK